MIITPENEYDMEQLLNEYLPGASPHVGDIIEGVVASINTNGIWMDIGSKYEGRIPPNEMQSIRSQNSSEINVGDKISALVLGIKDDEGVTLLSLDRAQRNTSWRLLEQSFARNETIEGKCITFNKGGLVVDINGISGFVPISHLTNTHPNRINNDANANTDNFRITGQKIKLKVIELEKHNNRVILSERVALNEINEEKKNLLLSELKEQDTCRGKVTRIYDFGVFVDLGGMDGLIPSSELNWGSQENEHTVNINDEIDVKVIKIDTESKKITLSLRLAQPDAWDNILSKYSTGQIVTGTITKVTAFGAFAEVDGVEGLIHISELANKFVKHPQEIVKKGDVLNLKIINIDSESHRIRLSLKQTQNENRADDTSNADVSTGNEATPEKVNSRGE